LLWKRGKVIRPILSHICWLPVVAFTGATTILERLLHAWTVMLLAEPLEEVISSLARLLASLTILPGLCKHILQAEK
jgi:hypothetical protein